MRATTLLLPFACLATSAGLAMQPAAEGEGRPPRAAADHHDPVLLNESAMDAIRQGDLATAWILLERAARIAPYDARIVRNLRELQAYRTGTAAPAEPAAPRARRGEAPSVPPEPPPLWPPRP